MPSEAQQPSTAPAPHKPTDYIAFLPELDEVTDADRIFFRHYQQRLARDEIKAKPRMTAVRGRIVIASDRNTQLRLVACQS